MQKSVIRPCGPRTWGECRHSLAPAPHRAALASICALVRKSIAPRCIHQQIVGAIDPLHVGAKLGLSTQIQRQVHTQTCGFGHRIDQAENGARPLSVK